MPNNNQDFSEGPFYFWSGDGSVWGVLSGDEFEDAFITPVLDEEEADD